MADFFLIFILCPFQVLRNTFFDRWYLWLPQGVVFYLLTNLCVKMNHEAYRKKPEDFINEGVLKEPEK